VYHVHFFVKRLKKQNGKIPVYCRITLHQERAEFSINTWVTEKDWERRNYNFTTIEMRLRTLYENLVAAGDVTAYQLREAYKGKKPKCLLKVFGAHLKEIKLLEQDYTISTYNCYKRAYEILQSFVRTNYHVQDLPLSKVDHTFVKGFDFYLKTQLKLSNNTVVKYLARLKKVVRLALANRWIEDDPFAQFKMRFVTANKEWLDANEIKRISKKKFSIHRLEKVKDVFLFCCYTGLSYSDVVKLTNQHIQTVGQEKWIVVNRTKTDITSRIPLLPAAEKILNKYSANEGKLLPVPTNQKMNAYLKEIADLCGVKKHLTVHLARHTFATTITLTNGVSMESVSKMLGHTNIKMTAHYSRIVDKKLSSEMNELKKKLKI
jgi:site-specific recombinase XerD